MTLRLKMTRAALGICLGSLVASVGFAQGASVSLGVKDHDSSIPVEITSENLELDQDGGTAIFDTDVFVRQGDMTITSDKMRVEYAEDETTGRDEIQQIVMTGGVTFASPTETAESDTAVYILASELIIMTGNVLVTQGRTALSSDKLTYNLNNGQGQMEGNVKTVLQQANN